VELERLERELELWLWSWSGWSAHEKVRTLLHFLACLLCCSVALLRVALPQRSKLRSQAPELCCALRCSKLRSQAPEFAARCFAARCFAATQQAPEPGSGALLRLTLLRLAPELY
jgi:hypothetical protein